MERPHYFLLQLGELEKALEVVDEAEYHAVGTELTYCRAACYFALENRSEGMETLRLALIEDLDMANLIFEILPSLKEDIQVHHLISYYLSEVL